MDTCNDTMLLLETSDISRVDNELYSVNIYHPLLSLALSMLTMTTSKYNKMFLFIFLVHLFYLFKLTFILYATNDLNNQVLFKTATIRHGPPVPSLIFMGRTINVKLRAENKMKELIVIGQEVKNTILNAYLTAEIYYN